MNGIMIPRHQDALGSWLDTGFKGILAQEPFKGAEHDIIEEFHGIINKI
jgi:hypothetical protein